jgi:3-hydroxyisobutyrate dehydrogenase
MTTGDPNATRAMAKELAAQGITLIDAPVSGGPHGADAGTIAIMVGASSEMFARVRPVFEVISPNIFHCGDVGTGQVMKLVNNVVTASIRTITFEAVTMGVKNGLASFTLGLMHKDVRLATELGVASGSPMLVAGLVREMYQTAINEHGADGDVNLMIRLFEHQSKVKVVP